MYACYLLAMQIAYDKIMCKPQCLLSCRLGKIAITAACGLLAFGLSDLTYYTDPVTHADTYLSSPLMPVLVSILVGYTISNLFLQVSCMYRCTSLSCCYITLMLATSELSTQLSGRTASIPLAADLPISNAISHNYIWTCHAGL